MTYPVAIKRYKMGRYILNVENTTSASKTPYKSKFQRIKASKRRRNMTYDKHLTKYRKERRLKLAYLTFIIGISIMAGIAINHYAVRSFHIEIINDQVVGASEVIASTAKSVEPERKEENLKFSSTLPVLVESGTVAEREIYIYNEAIKHKVNPDYAIRIAKSESHPYLDPYAKNPKSTAKGIYQFINSTWAENCKGDVYNWKSNVDCFMDNFNQHPQWWQESLDIEGIKIKSK